ncbi:MAG: CoB--CoM heterodisulfide reductase iron-sulfur subunit B family protein [Desulfovibrionaceae bacterium]
MKYAYYPGCSLMESARDYDRSTRLVLAALGAELEEIDGWTCCGASAAEAVDARLALALPARNLALAQRQCPGADVLAPCSACYLNLQKAALKTRDERALRQEVNGVLAAEDLAIGTEHRVRHLLDLLANELAERVFGAVRRPLEGLTVAPYYGCQILRPYRIFDDPERPVSMERVIHDMGAEVHPWDMGARCCGASLMVTDRSVALRSVAGILRAARGADVIATVCPLCQMNLEAYQAEASRLAGEDLRASVVYLPQLMGLAFGLGGGELMLNGNLALAGRMAAEARQTPMPAQAI